MVTVYGGKRIPAGRQLTTENTGHIYIRISDMKDGTVSKDNLLFVPEDIYNSISKYIIQKEDVYITVAGTIGKIGKIPKDLDGSNLTENADRLVFSFLYQDWLILCLSSEFVQDQIVEATTKVGQPKLAIKRIEGLLIALPPLSEQIRIVQQFKIIEPCLKNYDTLVNELHLLEKDFPDKLKKSILQLAIQGKLVLQNETDEPASILLQRILAEKEKLIKAGKIKRDKNESIIFRRDNSYYEKIGNEVRCIDDEIPFEIPDSWEWCRLGSILTKLSDGTHKTPKYVATGIPFVSVKDISKGTLDLTNCKFITEAEHADLFSRCNPEYGDLLLTKVGTTGIPVIVNTYFPFSLFVSVALLKFNQTKIFNKYLLYLIETPLVQKQAEENTRGVGNKNWVMKDISKTLIVLPPLAEQHRIVAKIEELLPKINSL